MRDEDIAGNASLTDHFEALGGGERYCEKYEMRGGRCAVEGDKLGGQNEGKRQFGDMMTSRG